MVQVADMASSLRVDVLEQNFDVGILKFYWNTPKFKMASKMAATKVRLVELTHIVDMYVDLYVILVVEFKYEV